MSFASLSSREFGRRFRKALSIELNIEQACSPSILQFITSYSKAIGCSEKSLFFPLLTCCATCMGPDACIELVPDWQELPIVWTMVITPTTLTRIDVAEHLKQQLLAVLTTLNIKSETGPQFNFRHVVDDINLDVLLDTMKSNNGQAVGIYNTTRVLHDVLSSSKEIEVLRRLHSGSSWFSSLKATKLLLSRTHMNFAILACPDTVQNSLSTCAHFPEAFNNYFLTICSEENHVKFSQLGNTSQAESLQKILKEIIVLHATNKIVYKLSEDGKEKFIQIHDEITDKSKQLARKNMEKVFPPILSYLGRLSCILHVLDNAIDAINCCVPIDLATWSCDINADTVWKARQVLGYVIEQKHVLNQVTTTAVQPSTPTNSPNPVTVVDNNSPQRIGNVQRNLFTNRSPTFNTPNRPVTSNNNASTSYQYNSPVRYSQRFSPRRRFTPPRPAVPPSDRAFDLLLSNRTSNTNSTTDTMTSETVLPDPVIVDVRSAGVSLPMGSILSSSDDPNNSANGFNKTIVTPQSVALMNNDEFFKAFKVHIRRILMHEMKDISLSQCVEMKFAPRHSGDNPTLDQKTAMARIFLKRLETLGFGLCDSNNGIASRQTVFKKRSFATLVDSAKQLLSNLRVNEREYDKCFNRPVVTPNANGVVCLE